MFKFWDGVGKLTLVAAMLNFMAELSRPAKSFTLDAAAFLAIR
jgi:hypothetical protein